VQEIKGRSDGVCDAPLTLTDVSMLKETQGSRVRCESAWQADFYYIGNDVINVGPLAVTNVSWPTSSGGNIGGEFPPPPRKGVKNIFEGK